MCPIFRIIELVAHSTKHVSHLFGTWGALTPGIRAVVQTHTQSCFSVQSTARCTITSEKPTYLRGIALWHCKHQDDEYNDDHKDGKEDGHFTNVNTARRLPCRHGHHLIHLVCGHLVFYYSYIILENHRRNRMIWWRNIWRWLHPPPTTPQ